MSKNEYNNPSYSNLDYQAYIKMAKMSSNHRDRQQSKTNQTKYQTNTIPFIQDRKPHFYRYGQLKQRYNQLENDYYDMIQKADQRKKQHQVLKVEIRMYEKYEEKDKSEIQRLTYLIGLHKRNKQEKLTQEMDIDFVSRLSRVNKFDQSTEDQIKLKNSAEMFRSRTKQQSRKKTQSYIKNEEKSVSKRKIGVQSQLQQRDKYKYETKSKNLSTFQKERYQQTKISKKINNPSYSRLRFVPHNQHK